MPASILILCGQSNKGRVFNKQPLCEMWVCQVISQFAEAVTAVDTVAASKSANDSMHGQKSRRRNLDRATLGLVAFLNVINAFPVVPAFDR
jgi:hypothetical protein